MATEYIYRENVPVYIDGIDFGIICTLVRDRDVDYSGIDEKYGLVAFTDEQADYLAELVNSHNDPTNPMDDYLQGSIGYDADADAYIEYYESNFVYPCDVNKSFIADGVKLYCIGSDWCWSLEKED